MLDWMFILLLIMAVLFMLLSVEKHEDFFWCITFSLVDIVLWYILSGAVLEIEVPYQIYNISSGAIETGVDKITTETNIALTNLFQMFAFIMMVFSVVYSMIVPVISVLRQYGIIKTPKKKNKYNDSFNGLD